MPMLGPVSILKKYFGLQPNQTLAQFGAEVKDFRESNPEGYAETVNDCANALGVEVKP